MSAHPYISSDVYHVLEDIVCVDGIQCAFLFGSATQTSEYNDIDIGIIPEVRDTEENRTLIFKIEQEFHHRGFEYSLLDLQPVHPAKTFPEQEFQKQIIDDCEFLCGDTDVYEQWKQSVLTSEVI